MTTARRPDANLTSAPVAPAVPALARFTRAGLIAFGLGVVATACTTAAQHQQQLGSTAAREMTVGIVQKEIRAGLRQDEVISALGSPNIVTRDAAGRATSRRRSRTRRPRRNGDTSALPD